MNESWTSTPSQPSPQKQRHGCFTAFLIFMIIANSANFILVMMNNEGMRRYMRSMPDWVLPVLIIGTIFNLVCAIALFRWYKWGFWGYLGSSIVMFSINLSIGIERLSALGGLLGVAILYGVLHIGNERKGWPQLE